MNFTSDVKKELIKFRCEESEGRAALSAYFSVCGSFAEAEINGKKQPRFFLVSETERVAEYFTGLFFDLFGERLTVSHAAKDRLRGRSKLVLEYAGGAGKILRELGLYGKTGFVSGVPREFFGDDKSRAAYLRGAFLGAGSLTLPAEEKKTGYHLEFAFPDRLTCAAAGERGENDVFAAEFCVLAEECDLLLKRVKRGGEIVAYMKSKEAISDFLSVAGAENALKKFTAFCEERERNNRVNRAANCSSSNADKSATAAVKQVMEMEKILAAGAAENLPAALKEVIFCRTRHPAMTMKEMAEELNVSKSCLNHRLRKIAEIAAKL